MFNPFFLATHFLRSQLRSLPVPTTSYAGRTVVVTGASGGLGLEAARHLVRLGAARVVLACRSTERGEAARAEIVCSGSSDGGGHDGAVVEVWPVDLCSFDSVRAFCRRADRELGRLDVLLANAGVMASDGRTAEGYDVTVTTNVVATFLMVFMLLPLMRRTAARFNVEPCVTVVASEGHLWAQFPERHQPRIFEAFRTVGSMWYDRYFTSKLMVVLVVRELAERLDACYAGASPVVANTANPGLCKSALFRSVPLYVRAISALGCFLLGRTCEEGARALLAAVAGGRESHGQYVDSGKVDAPSPFVLTEEGKALQKRLWDELLEVLEGIEPGVADSVRQRETSS